MSVLHVQSVGSPFDDPRLTAVAVAVLSRADAMGLLSNPITCLDESALQGLAAGLAEAGIGRSLLSRQHRQPQSDPAELSALLEGISNALEQSPAPAHEWRVLQGVLGLETLSRLVGVSQSSARRFLSGSRATPDPVAARFHFLALVVGDLAGAHNDIGVRRWFDRRRVRLDGKTPAHALRGAWSPDDDAPRLVRELALSLTASPAT